MNVSRRDEAAWIRHIAGLWKRSAAEVAIGDDACVLPIGRYALTTDTLVEGVDFERTWAPPEALGYKSLAANLSDLAAMGAKSRFFLLTLAIPSTVPDLFIEGVLNGMLALSEREEIFLCGGDLSSSLDRLVVSLTLVGEQKAAPLLRSGGRPGDILYLSGSLGAPAAALKRFEAGETLNEFDPLAPPRKEGDALLDRFYRPPTMGKLGTALAGRSLATCCIDISDGFAKDLQHLCAASGVGALVERELLPLDPLTENLSAARRMELGLFGGEEQALIFAASPGGSEAIESLSPAVRRIGRLVATPEIVLRLPGGRSEKLDPQGFDHFNR